MSSQSPSADLARSFARSARDDLDALVALHEIPGIADAVVGFHAQQAVEKALKATIVNAGGELHRTHDLRFLVRQARDLTIALPSEVADAQWLTPWAVELRYGEYLEEPLDRVLAVRAASKAVGDRRTTPRTSRLATSVAEPGPERRPRAFPGPALAPL